MKKAVLLNDTSYENHHGCNIVINNIKKNLHQRGINLIETNPIGVDWQKNSSFLKALTICDIVIVNAEGTIHHNSPYALSLLNIVNFTQKPTILMNMTYQNNSQNFAELVQRFTKIYVRESLSQNELLKLNIEAQVIPDMTFSSSYNIQGVRRSIYITDSHDIQLSEKLYMIASKQHLQFLPIIAPFLKYTHIKGLWKKIRFSLIRKYGKYLNILFKFSYPYLRYICVLPEKQFVEEVGKSQLIISARFHALCIAMQTMSPFIILKSNTHKIEGLLKDAHLMPNRIIEISQLDHFHHISNIETYFFTPIEQENIQRYLAEAKIKINTMFDEIASLIE